MKKLRKKEIQNDKKKLFQKHNQPYITQTKNVLSFFKNVSSYIGKAFSDSLNKNLKEKKQEKLKQNEI